MKMTDELKPCPFCGGPAQRGAEYGVYCGKCVPLMNEETWQSRVPAPTCAGWKRVEDGLPPDASPVLVWLGDSWDEDLHTGGGWWKHGRRVTHWREIHAPAQPCRCGEMEKDLRRLATIEEALTHIGCPNRKAWENERRDILSEWKGE